MGPLRTYIVNISTRKCHGKVSESAFSVTTMHRLRKNSAEFEFFVYRYATMYGGVFFSNIYTHCTLGDVASKSLILCKDLIVFFCAGQNNPSEITIFHIGVFHLFLFPFNFPLIYISF